MKQKTLTFFMSIIFVCTILFLGAPTLAAPTVTVKYECTDAGITNYGIPLYLYGAKLTTSGGVVKLTESNSFNVPISYLDYRLITLSENMAFRAAKLKAESVSMSEEELSDALSAMRSAAGYAVPGEGAITFTLAVKPVFAALARTEPYQATTIASTTVKNERTGASAADSRTPPTGNQAKGVAADVGEMITVTPTPVLGWRFKEWIMKYYPYALGTNYAIDNYVALPAQCGAKVDPITNAIEYTMPAGNVVAVALYEQGAAQHTIQFDLGGGVSGGGTGNQTLQDGEKAVKPPDPSKSGFGFGGWYTDNTFQKAWDFNAAMNGATAETITLYAKWTKLNTERTLSFSAGSGGSGTPPSAIKLETGERAALPANTFVKAGYLFGGWKADGSGPVAYLAGEEFTAAQSDVEFVAQWLKNGECTLRDVTNSLLGITVGNAQSYQPQIAAALEPLRLLITRNNATAYALTSKSIEVLYKSAFGITVSVGGGAAAGAGVTNAAFSASAQKDVTLTVDIVAESARKALPEEFSSYSAAAFDISLSAGGVALKEAAVPVVVSMPLPASLSGATNIKVLIYGSTDVPEVITPLLEGGDILFALKEFGCVTIVGNRSTQKPDEEKTAPGTTDPAQTLWDKLGQRTGAAPRWGTDQKQYGVSGPVSGYDRNGYPVGQSPNVKQPSAGSGGAADKNANPQKGAISAPSQQLQKAFKKLGNGKGIYEIKNASVSLSFQVGNVKITNARLMKYDEAHKAFIELGREQWTITGKLLVTNPLPPGVYGVLVK